MARDANGSARGRGPFALRLGISLAIGAGFAWVLGRGGLPIVPEPEAFAELAPWAVPIYLLSLIGVHWFRAARWRYLLQTVGEVRLRDVVSTSFTGFAAILFLPLRMGEVVRPYLVSKRGAVGGWQAAGTVAAERVIDGLVLSAVLFVGLVTTTALDPLPDHVGGLAVPVATVPRAAYGALALFAACFLLMALLYRWRRRALRLTRATLGRLSPRWGKRAARVLEHVIAGLGFLPRARQLAPFLLETGCYWGLNAAGLWLLAQGCGLPAIGFGQACVVMGCIGIGILVPAGPGYFGTFQISAYLALAMYVPPERVAVSGAAYVFIAYVSQLAQHLVGAGVGALLDLGQPAARLSSGDR
jgi:hypothetical protein